MFKSYLKIAWRNIWRNKAFSITNLSGLTIGMTCTMLILLWVQDELNWDKFHPDHQDIYQVMVNRDFNGEVNTDKSVPFPLAEELKRNFPQVKNATTDNYGSDIILKYNETIIKRRALNVSQEYNDVFQWKVVKGSAARALANPEDIILTASTARSLFGDADPLGKVVRVDNHSDYTVSAVVEDVPANSSIQFNALLPFNPSSDFVKQASTDWVNCFSQTFIKLQPGTDVTALNKQISVLANSRGEKKNFVYFLHPMDKWRLYSDFKHGVNTGGMISYVKLFTVIAIIILLIACVNFMNLSTAKSEKRAKEVGIRKTLGSERKQLLLQFYSESMIFSFIAFLLSVGAVFLLLPLFNSMINKQLHLDILDPLFILLAIMLIVVTGLVAGSYPALYLSSFNPVKVLKGTFLAGKNASIPRKVLVVLQFSISVLLISSTILVYQQIQHVKGRDLGYNPNNLISIPSSDDANKNAEVIRNELIQTGLVSAVTRTSSPVTDIWNYTPAPNWKGKPQNADLIMSAMRSDIDFGKTVGARMIQGRDFMNTPGDTSVMLLNKEAVSIMQLKDPIGMEMQYGNRKYTVVGITDNIVMTSPYAPVKPMMVLLERRGSAFFLVRLKDGVQPQQALSHIETIFKKYNPQYPFDFSFVDQQFNQKFVTEDLIGKLTNLFAGLAIFICCLGLSGLTAFTIEKRFKEIGIRKVLGASIRQLLFLISKEFLYLVLLAALISIPVTWWILHNWLEGYEYRVTITIWLFAGSCAGVLLLTMVIVWLNSLRAALANPVNSLRSE
ncbi:ABC transporter permease [Flavisolibacter ginsengisoli]|jgi:ABC-type antimicrobial peptide transport system permease subunit|uniref:FtsX-like permease family protein n=1 Tax=Flavisolibacter ginsengisoli DSM 18119 TaxID=1121884 RepID=A0A1M4STV7_9BACT|nr:ABC transporter permease [Flavisolibacter ginsengisoli]SHE35599.1 FtsX-like permease family protein [Flavisolibacter ginsengisoli DSM 18119]